jgi:hypothetical protein
MTHLVSLALLQGNRIKFPPICELSQNRLTREVTNQQGGTRAPRAAIESGQKHNATQSSRFGAFCTRNSPAMTHTGRSGHTTFS